MLKRGMNENVENQNGEGCAVQVEGGVDSGTQVDFGSPLSVLWAGVHDWLGNNTWSCAADLVHIL